MPTVTPLFNTLLVANRGEIALRIIRSARDLGIHTVAVYSDADAALPHVRYADEAHLLGPAPAADSYLNIERILDVARRSGAQAVHPGYGFLAENAAFARACRDAGLTFVGPPPEALAITGDKIAARRAAQDAGVPIIPGSIDPVTDVRDATRVAARIGYPLLVKPAGGGGGKGIRVAHHEEQLARAMASARREAALSFGDGAIFIEKWLRPARHIEIQLLADQHGDVVTLGERECSIQRRRQKLLEESPSPALTPALRERMEEAAQAVARAGHYVNAGTVEFLVTDQDHFTFLEMNSRLQVEHPVTELVRDMDLVAEQLRLAAGEPLGYTAAQRPPKGWAMECRIVAEDPYSNFLPSVGTVSHFREPAGPGVRVDSMLYPGMEVSVHYDSLLAKLAVWGRDREHCRRRMIRALREFTIVGISTSIPFHLALLDDPKFIAGQFHTDSVQESFTMHPEARPQTAQTAALAAAAFLREQGERSLDPGARNGAGQGGWSRQARHRRALEQGWRRGSL